MKITILLLVSTVVLASLVLIAHQNAKIRTASSEQLPANCILLATSPADRLAHQRRLENLSKAAQLSKEINEGFVFTVDLHQMSFGDLELWVENEQKCCSFLRMTSHILEKDVLAEVTVVCPAESRAQVMRTFGLLSDDKTLTSLNEK